MKSSFLSWTKAVLFFGCLTNAAASDAAEHFIESQSGSMHGLAHLSYGLKFNNKHSLSMGVGFVPEMDNHEEMTITSYRYRFEGETRKHFLVFGNEIEISPYNFGLSVISGHQDEIYSSTPDYIPSGYYMPTARRVLFNYQTVIKFDHKIEAYMDWTILDVGLINYARNFDFYRDNYDFLGLEGIVSYGFGLRKSF